MLLIQYIKNSVFSVSSVVNLLNQILSQSLPLLTYIHIGNTEK
jgi:hypothetical protein